MRYLAALHAVDYSRADNHKDKLDDTAASLQRWRETVAVVLSNLAAAFGGKSDHYNSDRAASLGLGFALKLVTATDDRRDLRRKLLYRRGLARSKGAQAGLKTMSQEDAVKDITEASALDTTDRKMRATLRDLKALVAKKDSSRRGFLEPTKKKVEEEEEEDDKSAVPPRKGSDEAKETRTTSSEEEEPVVNKRRPPSKVGAFSRVAAPVAAGVAVAGPFWFFAVTKRVARDDNALLALALPSLVFALVALRVADLLKHKGKPHLIAAALAASEAPSKNKLN